MGDFNKDLSFTNFNREWSDFTTSLGLRQLVTQSTRVTDTSSTLIDHRYSSIEENLRNVHMAEFGISDHYAIFCNRKVNFSFKMNSHKSIKYRSLKHFDENAFLQRRGIRLKLPMMPLNVDNHAPIRCHRIKVMFNQTG